MLSQYKDNLKEEIDNETYSILESIISSDYAREGILIPGSIPLNINLLDVLFDQKHTYSYTQLAMATKILGFAKAGEIRQAIKDIALTSKNVTLRGWCTAAIGSVADQQSLDMLTALAMDTKTMIKEETSFPGFTLPQTLSSYARIGIRQIVYYAPHLDFEDAMLTIQYTLANNMLPITEIAHANATVKIINNRAAFEW
jgi:hypothetical protein